MKELLSLLTAFIVLIIVALGISWLAEGNDFFLYKYFAPRQAAVQRQVFENTPSYVDGMNEEIQNEMIKYNENTNNQTAMRDIILDQTSKFPDDQLTPNNRAFVQKLRNQTGF